MAILWHIIYTARDGSTQVCRVSGATTRTEAMRRAAWNLDLPLAAIRSAVGCRNPHPNAKRS
jgi:hypothetical protein